MEFIELPLWILVALKSFELISKIGYRSVHLFSLYKMYSLHKKNNKLLDDLNDPDK